MALNKLLLNVIIRSRKHFQYKRLRKLLGGTIKLSSSKSVQNFDGFNFKFNFYLTLLYKYHSLLNCFTLYFINELTNLIQVEEIRHDH